MSYPNIDLPYTVLLQAPITTSTFRVTNVIDEPNTKTVKARIIVTINRQNFIDHILVWSGADYDNAGQWTDNDLALAVKQRILEKYPAV